MDERRLSTGDFLAAGMLGLSAPQTDIPRDREQVECQDDGYHYFGDQAFSEAIEAGKLVHASNYYGCPSAWKAGDGVYRGTLLQYRAVTENPTFATVVELAEWFKHIYHSTDG